MARIACLVALTLLIVDFAARLQAQQTPPRFEIASVKKVPPPTDPILVSPGGRRGDRWRATNATLRMLIRAAYAPQFQQEGTIVGGPAWLDTDRFDINASADPSISIESMRLMAQALLTERFQMAVRRESRELPAYVLVHARADRRPGPALRTLAIDCDALRASRQRGAAPPPAPPQPGKPPADCITMIRFLPSAMRIDSGGMTIEELLGFLSQATGRPVLDQTGLTGHFALTVEFATDGTLGPFGERVAPSARAAQQTDTASVFAAVEDQLGLKLESRRSSVDVLVIDRAEQPTPD